MKSIIVMALLASATLGISHTVKAVAPNKELVHKGNMDDTKAGDARCLPVGDSKITLLSGEDRYTLSVPANGTTFDVIGPHAQLRCNGFVSRNSNTMYCQACNFPVQVVQVSAGAGICLFNFTGLANLVYLNEGTGLYTLPIPSQIWTVQCGLND